MINPLTFSSIVPLHNSEQEPSPPPRIAKAVIQADKFATAGQFSEAVSVLEKQQLALGSNISREEKLYLLSMIADLQFAWGSYFYSEKSEPKNAIIHFQKSYLINNIYSLHEDASPPSMKI
ncbi:hypothetical protein [Armatimonas sp.]|uniref:hypothetical protein n=1 Tax=Armatimonas sp. TaxID=1872638 RepID=UPI00286A719B|nr:hypothetical protein [Armatimonas sp.]